MSGLEDQWKGKVAFIRKGTQEDGTDELMSQCGFDGVPSVIVFDASGKEVTRFLGYKSADEITSILQKATSP